MTDQQHIRKVYRQLHRPFTGGSDTRRPPVQPVTLVLVVERVEPGERQSDRAGEGEDRDVHEEQG